MLPARSELAQVHSILEATYQWSSCVAWFQLICVQAIQSRLAIRPDKAIMS